MGMFDNVYLIDPAARAQCTCALGHLPEETTEFQTKDLDCLMDDYFVVDGKLHRRSGRWLVDESMPPPEGHGEPIDYTGQVRFYAACRSCPETLWENPLRHSNLGPHRQTSWNEFVALFHRGKLLIVEPVTRETIEEVRKKMTTLGWTEVKDEK